MTMTHVQTYAYIFVINIQPTFDRAHCTESRNRDLITPTTPVKATSINDMHLMYACRFFTIKLL